MEKEAMPVIGAMHAERDFIFCGKRVLCGTLYGKRAGIVVCGVGKVNAACGTQIAVDELGADEIINVGVVNSGWRSARKSCRRRNLRYFGSCSVRLRFNADKQYRNRHARRVQKQLSSPFDPAVPPQKACNGRQV